MDVEEGGEMNIDGPNAPRGPWIRLRDGGSIRLWELSLDEISTNQSLLQARGVYERALLVAFVRTNHADWPLERLRVLLKSANRTRLRGAGDPLPGPGPFTVYRGVSGADPEARRVRGLSWTASLERAREFAERFQLQDPGVYEAIVQEQHVLAYLNWREEEEFIVLLPTDVHLRRVE